MGVKKEDFLTYCTFLLYGNINTAPGPDPLSKAHGFRHLGRWLRGHHNHALVFSPTFV